MAQILQQTTYVRMFYMALTAGGDATGLSPTVELSKNGSAFAAAAGVVTEVSDGWYKIALTTVDTNTAGMLAYHIEAATANDVDVFDEVVSQAQLTATSVGATASYAPTRNALIEMAYRKCRAIGAGETLQGYQLSEGIAALNLLVRQMDAEGTQIWAIGSAPSTITLQNNLGIYASAEGLPTNIMEITKASLRGAYGGDKTLTVMSHESYEAIANKFTTGDPTHLFLVRHRNPASQSLYVWPLPANVGTQSEVTGTDSLNYRCIRTHTSESTNRPITGANWRLYWEQAGSSGSTWVTDTAYTSPKLLRIWYKRPLADFTAANDNPDLPPSQSRLLLYRLASDLSIDTGKDEAFERRLDKKAEDAEARTFRKANKVHSTNTHNKVTYY